MPLESSLFVLAADPLEIADVRQCSIFKLRKETFGGPVEEVQFLLQQRCPLRRQALNQVFEHGTQSPRDLNALASEVADFRDGQAEEIRPVRRPIDQAQPPRGVVDVSVKTEELKSMAAEAGFVVVNLSKWADGYRPEEGSRAGRESFCAEPRSFFRSAFTVGGNWVSSPPDSQAPTSPSPGYRQRHRAERGPRDPVSTRPTAVHGWLAPRPRGWLPHPGRDLIKDGCRP